MIELSNPLSRPWHFLGLELVMLACAGLGLWHALSRYRTGDRRHLFQWLAIFTYGIAMELIAFNFIDNYEHARFTVQLYHGQLPLYVTAVYVVFLYTGLELVQRLDLRPLPEALLAGFAMCLLDVPFDVSGVITRWWIWLDGDPNTAVRWLGVPVTSYYWYLIFGAVLSLLCRAVWPRLERRPFALAAAVAPLVGLGVIAGGVVAFLPFHALEALGLGDGLLVAAHLALVTVLAVAARPGRARAVPRLVAAAAVLVTAFHLAVLFALAFEGALPGAPWRIGAAVAAAVGVAAFLWLLPIREPRAEMSPAAPIPG